MFGPTDRKVGIVCQGGMYNAVVRALQRLGLCNLYGDTDIPLYVLNVTYPLLEDEFLEFAKGKDSVLVVEEGYPEYIEQALRSALNKAGSNTKLHGKGVFPQAGELTATVMLDSISAFLRDTASNLMPSVARAPNAPHWRHLLSLQIPSRCDRRVFVLAVRSGRYLRRPNWSKRNWENITLPATLAAICFRSMRRSTWAQRRWDMDLDLPQRPLLTTRPQTGGLFPFWGTGASGTTG